VSVTDLSSTALADLLIGPQLDELKVKVSLKPTNVLELFLWTRKLLKEINRGYQLHAKEVHVKFNVHPIVNKFKMPGFV